MARGKWFLPYKKNQINYEDIGVLPYLVQHDIGFSGDKIFTAMKWNGPGWKEALCRRHSRVWEEGYRV